MSIENYAILHKADMPERAPLEAAIRALGFDLTLDSEFKPLEGSGFLPCLLMGKESGFEMDYQSAESFLGDYPELWEGIGDRDCVVAFRFGSDMAEGASATIVGAALTSSFRALFYSSEMGELQSADDLVAEAHEFLSYVK